MATNNKVKNVVLGVTAVTTVVAGAYTVTNLLYKERDYSDVLVESAKKYVENNNLAIDSKLVTSASRLQESGSLVSSMKDECINNSYVTITNEDGTYKYEPSLTCETDSVKVDENENQSDDSNLDSNTSILTYKVLPSSTRYTNGNVEVQVRFSEQVQKVDEEDWVLSNDKKTLTKIYTENGEDSFEVVSLDGEKNATVNVSATNIDKEAPVILVNGKDVVSNYGTGVTLNVQDDNLKDVLVNGDKMTSNAINETGSYEVVATDEAGNKTVAKFSLGKTTTTNPPVINRITEGGVYTELPYRVSYYGDEATLYKHAVEGEEASERPINSGGAITEEGKYTLTVRNSVGEVSVNFSIDQSDPEVWAETEDGTKIVDGQSINKDVIIHFKDKYSNVVAKSNTLYRDLKDGEVFTKEGKYVITVTDGAGHVVTFNFTINRQVPTVEGVVNGKFYSENRTITFDDKGGTVTATLDGLEISSGHVVSDEGEHTLVLTDDAGNSGTTIFTIDKTAPEFEGLDSDLITKDDFVVKAIDTNLKSVTVKKNGLVYANSEVTLDEEGLYTLIATDKAGLVTTRTVTIDKTAPSVLLNGSDKYEDKYENEVNIEISDLTKTTVMLDGKEFTDTKITASGNHVLEVTDEVGLTTRIEFTIYKDKPEVNIDGKLIDDETSTHYFNHDITINIVENPLELTATLNGEELSADEIANGKTIYAIDGKHNEYTLVVTDSIGRSTTIKFVIDQKNPTSSVGSQVYGEDILITFEDESGEVKAELDGVEIENGKVTLSEEGEHTLKLTDKAGNAIVYYPTIDKSTPDVKFIVDGEEIVIDDITKKLYFNKEVTITFEDKYSSVAAKLNNASIQEISDGKKDGSVVLNADGEYVLYLVDKGENELTVTVEIDSANPKGSISYENIDDATTDRLVDSIKMILTVDEEITFEDSNGYMWLKLNEMTEDGKYQYVYTVNDSVTGSIKLIDKAENEVSLPYSVTIDKTAPVGSITANTEEDTNKDVTLTLTVDEEVTITDNNGNVWNKLDELTEDGKYQYATTITENISGAIVIADANNNKTEISYKVENIDKIVDVDAPTYSTTEITNQDVIITIKAREELTFTDELDWTVLKLADGTYSYTATAIENISNTIVVSDKLGNTKNITYVVNNIDKDAPEVGGFDEDKFVEAENKYLFNTIVTPTFTEGTATLNGNVFVSGTDVTESGDYVLIVTDEAGNFTTINFTIDRTKPEAEITPSTTAPTNQPVILTIKTSEPVTMLTENKALEQIDNQTWTFKKSINGTITFKFTDAAGNVGTAKYTVENIDKVKPTISGVDNKGEYNEIKNVTFEDDKPGVTATLNGEIFLGGEIADGKHVLIVTDAAGNTVTYRFTIDTIDPIITGVVDQGLYNKNVRPSYNEGTAVLTKKTVAEDGSIVDTVVADYVKGASITEDGIYTLTVTDAVGNDTVVTFTIDKTAPTAIITQDPTEDKYTNGAVILTFEASEPIEMLTESSALTKVSDTVYTFKKSINGTITFKFKDLAGNTNSIRYTVDNIDKTKPIVTGVENKGIYNAPVTIMYSDDHNVGAMLNDEFFTSGNTVSEDGKYTLVVTDEADNKVTYTFTIDTKAPEITGVEDKGVYNKNVRPSYNEGTGVLTKKVVDEDGAITEVVIEDYKKGAAITEDGIYTLTVTDGANNSTAVTFTIDKTAPTAEITPSTTAPTNQPVILTIKTSEPVTMLTENKALEQIDNQTWTFKKSINGTITFKFTDAAGNVGTARYTVENIDKEAPVGTITADVTAPTKGSVTLTLEVSEPIKDMSESDWTLVKDATLEDRTVRYTKTLSENTDGEIELTYTDLAGNKGSVKYEVSNIDNIPATADVTYSTTEDTNEDVTIMINTSEKVSFEDELLNWTETRNEDGTYTYTATATENVSNTLTLTDEVGNVTENVVYSVNNIDKTSATADVTYSTTEDTNEDVTITINTSKKVSFEDGLLNWTETKNENGTYTYTATATENVSNTLTLVDHVGNETEVSYSVENIDKTPANATVSYDKTESTTGSVEITITSDKAVTFEDDKLEWSDAVEEDGKFIYTATASENVSNTLTLVDHVGNITTVTYSVENIDHNVPTITIEGGNVIVTIKGMNITYPQVSATDKEDGELTVTADKTEVDINEAGEHTITYTATDSAGNTATETLTIRVINVDKYNKLAAYMNMLEENSTGGFFFSVNENKYDYTDKSWQTKKMYFDALTMMVDGTIKLNPNITQEYMDKQIETVENMELIPAEKDMYDYNTVIGKIAKLVESDYTKETWAELMTLKSESEVEGTLRLQSDVNYYSKALERLVKDLEKEPVVDTTEDYRDKYKEEDYSGYDAYQEALTELSTAVSEGILKSEYEARLEEIEEAILATRLPIDASAYEAILKDLEDNYEEADYTNESWTALQEKLNAVQAVIDRDGLRSEYNAALEQIDLNDLVANTLDTTEFDNIVIEFGKLIETDYTAESWTAIENQIAKVQAIIDNNGLISEYEKELANLSLDNLEALAIDTTEFDKIVAEFEQLVEGDYTSESYTALKELIDEAKELIANDALRSEFKVVFDQIDLNDLVAIPKATNVTFVTDGANGYATIGNKLTLEFNSNTELDLTGTEVTINGEQVTVSKEGDLYRAVVTVDENTKEGKVTYTIKPVGPNGLEGAEVSVESDVIVDITEPTIEISGDKVNGQNNLYTSTVTVTVTESNVKEVYVNGVLDASFVSPKDFTEDGTYTIKVIDQVGNEETVTFTIDTKAPNGTITSSNEDPTNEDITLTFEVDEEIIIIDGGNWTRVTNEDPTDKTIRYTLDVSENGIYEITYKDLAGHTGSASYEVENIDKTPAKTTLIPSTGGQTMNPVTLTLTSDEPLIITSTTDEWTASADKKTFTLVVTSNRTVTVEYTDLAGNAGSKTYTVSNIDTEAPTATIEADTTEDTNQDITLTLNASEEIVITSTTDEWTKVTGSEYTLVVSGNRTVTVEFKDLAGHTGSVSYTVANIDKTPATADVTYSNTNMTNQDVVITLTSDEAVTFEDDKLEWSDAVEENGKFIYTATATENVSNTLTLVDHVGNTSTVSYTVENIDKTAPTATFVGVNPEGPTNSFKEITIRVDKVVKTTNTGTIPTVEVKVDEETGAKYTLLTAKRSNNGKYMFKFEDEAGNSGSFVYEVEGIDKEKPTAELYEITPEGPTNGHKTITIKTSEKVISLNTGTQVDVENKVDEEGNEYSLLTANRYNNGSFSFIFQDEAGNKGTFVIDVTGIDKEAPKGTITANKTDITNEEITLTLTVDEAIKDLSDSEWTLIKDATESDPSVQYQRTVSANGEIVVNYKDLAGNAGSASIEITNFDDVAPTITLTDENTKVEEGIYNGAVTVTVNDANADKVYVNGVLDAAFGTSKTFSEDGVYTIKAVDKAGNESSEVTFKIYKTAPTITIEGGNVIVTIKGMDITYPKVTATSSVDGELTVTADKTEVDINEAGEHTITYTATDSAGNTASETLTIRVINVDKYNKIAAYMEMLETNSTGGFYFSVNENKYDYTDKSWQTKKMYFDALTMMVDGTIKLNPNITQEYMDKQIETVENMELIPAEKDMYDYNTVIGKIAKLVESDYTKETWAELMTLKSESEVEGTLRLQSDVNYYSKALERLVKDLEKEPVVDTTEDYRDKYKEEDYSGYDAYQEALTELSTAVSEGILKSEYEARLEEIEEAILATRLPIDASAYEAILKDLEDNYEEADYTNESWTALQEKLNAVQAVIDRDGLRSEYNAALEQIDLSELVLIPVVVNPVITTTGNVGYAKAGDVIKLEFESNVELNVTATEDEPLVTTATINGQTAIVTKNAETGKYEASITITDSSKEGIVSYTITPVGPNQLVGTAIEPTDSDIVVDVTPADTNMIPSNTSPTVGPVVITLTSNEELIITSEGWTKVEGKNEYTSEVTANKVVTVEYTDLAGNYGSASIEVENIDLVDPTANIVANTSDGTNQDVILTLTPSEEIIITSTTDVWTKVEGKNEYTLTVSANREVVVEFEDLAGRKGSASYNVTNIDKTPAKATVSYTDADKVVTNKDVTITLTSDKELSAIRDTNGMNWIDSVQTENGSFVYSVTVSENVTGTLTLVDLVGNETIVEYAVSNIDKVLPEATITYVTGTTGNENIIDGDTPTKEDVTIKLTSTKKLVEIVDSNNMNWMNFVEGEVELSLNEKYTYRVTVSKNIAGTLNIKDEAGNTVEGIEYNVSGIDKDAPVATLEPNTTEMTNQDVKLTLNVTNEENVTIKNSNVNYELVDGKYVFTVEENTEVSVTIADAVGNETVVTYNVENIDKDAPNMTIIDKNTGEEVTSGMYIKGSVIVTVDEGIIYDNNAEVASGSEISSDGVHRIYAVDAAGNTTKVIYVGIDNTAPVVSGVEDGMIYDGEVTINATDMNSMTATMDGEAFTLGESYNVSGHHTLVVTDRVGNSTTVEFDIDTEAPVIELDGEQVNGIYTEGVTVNVTDDNIDTIMNGEVEITNGSTIDEDGTHTITATDKAGHTVSVTFTIDTKDPVIEGFEDGKTYSEAITVTVSDANLVSITLADGTTIESGATFTEDGTYSITAVDAAGHSVTKTFTIDSLPPVVTGVEDGKVYTDDVTLEFDKGTATVNGETVESGTVLSDGKYTVVVTSDAGKKTELSFIVDTKAPVINGFDDESHYSVDVTVNVEDHNIVSIKNNGEEITNGTTFTEDGVYVITATDIVGREVTKTFTIDKTDPNIAISGTSINNNGIYTGDVTISVEDANISTIVDKDGNEVEGNATFTEDGTYTITATDKAGNETTVTFTIDNASPVVSGVEDGEVYGEKVTVSFDKGTATLNGVEFTNGTEVSDGRYELVVTGENGKTTSVTFYVDTLPPEITSIKDGMIYGNDVTIEFNDATTKPIAKLDGKTVQNGDVISKEGNHTLIVIDEAGNSTSVTFTIDKTAPELEIVDNKGVKHKEDFEVTLEADKVNKFENFEYNVTDRDGASVSVDINGVVDLATLGDNYTLTYKATDDVGNTRVITVTVKVKDTTAPTITLGGNGSAIEVKYGSSFADTYGATAEDTFDGELEVKTSHNVNVYEVGTYEITYTATDASGNETTEKRTVKVVSTTATDMFKEENSCTDGEQCYATNSTDNYIWYSGHLWRVVKVNADGTLRIVTEESATGFSFDDNSSVFTGSHAERWLNNVFYPSLNNASTIVSTGEFCSEKMTSLTNVRYTCSANSVVKSKVGLLTIDEYNILGGANGFLNNGERYFTMTPTSEDTAWVVEETGRKERGYYVNEPYAMRPVININPVDILKGRGTAADPYVIDEGNKATVGSNLTNRSTGEYVNFGGKAWRIVSTSNEGTKLIADNYLTTNDGYVNIEFGTVGAFNTTSGIGKYLNTTVYDGFTTKEKSVIKMSRWYYNKYLIGQSPMDTTLVSGGNYTDAYVGLIRVGELMSGTTSTARVDKFTYWTLNSAHSNTWFVNWAGTSEYSPATNPRGVRPVITLNSSVKIKSGNGTAANPYELEY